MQSKLLYFSLLSFRNSHSFTYSDILRFPDFFYLFSLELQRDHTSVPIIGRQTAVHALLNDDVRWGCLKGNRWYWLPPGSRIYLTIANQSARPKTEEQLEATYETFRWRNWTRRELRWCPWGSPTRSKSRQGRKFRGRLTSRQSRRRRSNDRPRGVHRFNQNAHPTNRTKTRASRRDPQQSRGR